MQNIQPSMSAFTDTKSHYDLLDGLRGGLRSLSCGFTYSKLLQPAIGIKGLIMVIWPSIFSLYCRGLLSVMLMTTVGGK